MTVSQLHLHIEKLQHRHHLPKDLTSASHVFLQHGALCCPCKPHTYIQGPPQGWQDIYNRDPWHLGNSTLRLPTAGIHHPQWQQRRSTTINSNWHQDSLHKGSTLFVLYEGAAVSARGKVVVVWQTPLTRRAHCWCRLECHLASPKLPLPGWNAVFATWWFSH